MNKKLPFIILLFVITLSLNPASTRADSPAYQDRQATAVFQAGDTTHIVEHIPGMKALLQDTLFWLSLNIGPDLFSYVLLQVTLLYPSDKGFLPGIDSTINANHFVRKLIWYYKLYRLYWFAWNQATPVISQINRWTNCSRKTGTSPVYIMDRALARAFSIKVWFADQGSHVVFRALEPSPLKDAPGLPAAWQKLFDQLHQLATPTLYASIRTIDQLTVVCLNKTPEQGCDILLSAYPSDQQALPVFWDIEMAGQWCPQSVLNNPERGYSIFSTSVIDAMANALAMPEHSWFLPSQLPYRMFWQGNSAVLDSTAGLDYQVGWSGTALHPGSPGFIALASQEGPRLTPENMEHTFSNWQHWFSSYQKHWPATPLQWVTTLSVNHFSGKIRQSIFDSAWKALTAANINQAPPPRAGVTQAIIPPLPTPGVEVAQAMIPNHPPSPWVEAAQAMMPDSPPISGTEEAQAITSLPLPPETTIYKSDYTLWDKIDYTLWDKIDYTSWGFHENNKVLVARTIALQLTDLARAPDHYRSQTETEYLQSGQPSPKPVTLILPGVPTGLHLHNFDLVLLLAVPQDRALAPYKANINSKASKDLDSYNAKRHPGLLSLIQKNHEINLRRFPLLVDHSWGHTGKDGQPTLPKLSSLPEKHYTSVLPENEVILTRYSIKDIKGVIVTEDTPLLLQHDRREPLAVILDKKSKLENKLGLKTLPVYFYNQRLGRIVDSVTFTQNKFELLRAYLESLSQDFIDFGTNLPAFFGTRSFEDYLNTVTKKTVALRKEFPEHKSELNAIGEGVAERFRKLIFHECADESFFLGLAKHPDMLMLRRPLSFEFNGLVLAGASSSVHITSNLRLIAFVFGAQPNTFIDAYQKRSRLVDQIINAAGLTESFSKRPVTAVDLSGNPVAALAWIQTRGCDIADSGKVCMREALARLRPLKDHPDEQRKYFNQIVNPLFKELLSRNKLTKQSLNKFIEQTIALLKVRMRPVLSDVQQDDIASSHPKTLSLEP